jgi:regulator of sigma E protease
MMNILLAVLILTASYIQGVSVPRYPKEPAIVGPVAANSPARLAGLKTGDQIITVNGNRVSTWEDMEVALGTAPRDALNVEVSRNNEIVSIHFDAPPKEKTIGYESLGFKFALSRTIVYLVDGNTPAFKAGLKEGDEILSVNKGDQIGRNYSEILNIISESEGVPLKFKIRRPNAKIDRDNMWASTPSENDSIQELTIAPIKVNGRVIVGFGADYPSDLQQYGFIGALTQSVQRNYELSALTFRIIGRIIRGSASARTLSGPIEIARISGSAARTGSARIFFGFLGLISLQLGVFNLLPIPILDGGVIMLLIIEGAIRRDISIKLKEKIFQVGFVFLILLMGFVVFNDLSKIIDFNRIFR